MDPIVVTKDLAAKGMKVIRGPHWEWGDQDGGRGQVGTIIDDGVNGGWVTVEWPNGRACYYRVGSEGKYDLAMHNPFTSVVNTVEKPQTQRLQQAREAMSHSIKRTDSFIEKSNTKHGNSNTSSRVSITSTGAIKVRRSSSKIKGSEGRRS